MKGNRRTGKSKSKEKGEGNEEGMGGIWGRETEKMGVRERERRPKEGEAEINGKVEGEGGKKVLERENDDGK